MKNKINIYLAGGMQKFGKEGFFESNNWRRICQNYFQDHRTVKIINPNDYFNFYDEEPAYISQKEVMEFDLHKVRNCDLTIVNFNDPKSLGTMTEIAIAYEKKIPIVGLNETNEKLHPWQIEMTNRIFTDIHSMLKYVEYFYIT